GCRRPFGGTPPFVEEDCHGNHVDAAETRAPGHPGIRYHRGAATGRDRALAADGVRAVRFAGGGRHRHRLAHGAPGPPPHRGARRSFPGASLRSDLQPRHSPSRRHRSAPPTRRALPLRLWHGCGVAPGDRVGIHRRTPLPGVRSGRCSHRDGRPGEHQRHLHPIDDVPAPLRSTPPAPATNHGRPVSPVTTTDSIYLDHNATTPLLPEVVEAMLPHLRGNFGNPSSTHSYGTRARGAVSRAREQVAALLGCNPDEVIFTSGGTEASNLGIRGVLEAAPGRSHVVTTRIEHPATTAPCSWLEKQGHRITRIGVDSEGRALVQQAQESIDHRTALVTVMHSNNETGVLQPIATLAKLAHAVGALVHTDAAQSVGKVPVRVGELDVDLLSVAGHKLYAPQGVGALYVKRGTPLAPLVLGGGQERGLRPGTENVASIVGLGSACEA